MTTREARKFDDSKARMDLLPYDALYEIAQVMGYGAQKYGEWNYLKGKGLRWVRVYAATLRHLGAWSLGVDKDEETQLPHLAHAGANILMLLTLVRRRKGKDTRHRAPPTP